MAQKLTPVILSGGAGTRLWPLSRQTYPKQLLPLIDDESLLKKTARRFSDTSRFEAPVVIANDTHRFLIAQQLVDAGIDPAALILEPLARNTALAAAVAALKVSALHGPGAIMGIFASDHLISGKDAFNQAIEHAIEAAIQSRIVCLGAKPTRAETGYGYIETGGSLTGVGSCMEIASFAEKPSASTAETYLRSGRYLWNMAMFVSRASTMIEAFELHAGDILDAARQALGDAKPDLGFERLSEPALVTCPSAPIDTAIMEKINNGAVVAADFDWSDVGGYRSLLETTEKDDAGNAEVGSAVAHDCKESYLRGEDGVLVAGLGLEKMAIVATADAVLAAPLERAGEIRDLVARLGNAGLGQTDTHRKVYRPWGSYEDIDVTERFRVKRIIVSPGARLSLQRHAHRSEHWIVVEGEATVTIGEMVSKIGRNQSTYVPVGETHRLENNTDRPLHMIEVQVGDYVGEDDIERLEDIYGRISLQSQSN